MYRRQSNFFLQIWVFAKTQIFLPQNWQNFGNYFGEKYLDLGQCIIDLSRAWTQRTQSWIDLTYEHEEGWGKGLMPANLEIRILRFLVLASDPCLQTVQMSQQRPRLMHRKYKSAFRNKVETWFNEVHVQLVFLKSRNI